MSDKEYEATMEMHFGRIERVLRQEKIDAVIRLVVFYALVAGGIVWAVLS